MASIVKEEIIPSEDPRELAELKKYDDYFDIMLIGKTGLGKTTTADKILLANTTGRGYREEQRQKKKEETLSLAKSAIKASGVSQIQDLSMWLISNDIGDLDSVEKRLKNLVFCRLMQNPHEEINRLREDSEVTRFCELLSNDTSKVRVLDVPGFFGPEVDIVARDILERAEAIAISNLQIMRNILHIKAAYHFKFNRIVYFLPEQGVLRRNNQILQMEIQTMEAYFGRSIFECMVVAATHDRSAYESFPKDAATLFSPKDYETTKVHLQQAMRSVFGDFIDVPRPPVEFLSYRDTCETIVSTIKNAKVIREGVQLTFNSSTCARCNIRLKRVKANLFSAKKVDKDKDTDVVMCLHPGSLIEMPYNDTSCHPMIIPKYSILQRILGGIAHVILPSKSIREGWPRFRTLEEICIACGGNPGSTGCRRVRHLYRKKCHLCKRCTKCQLCSEECKKSDEWTTCSKCRPCRLCKTCPLCKDGILVNHTDKVQEKYKLTRQVSKD